MTIDQLLHHTDDMLLPEMNIKQAVRAFDRTEAEALVVVNSRAERRVIGLLTEAHALRRYTEALELRRRDVLGGGHENRRSGVHPPPPNVDRFQGGRVGDVTPPLRGAPRCRPDTSRPRARPCSRVRRRHRLAVDIVGDVAGREHAGQSVRSNPAPSRIAVGFCFSLPTNSSVAGAWPIATNTPSTSDRFAPVASLLSPSPGAAAAPRRGR